MRESDANRTACAARNPPSADRSGQFWAAVDPRVVRAVERHNRRIGGRIQTVIQKLLLGYVLSAFAYLALRLLFRVRVLGKERLSELREGAIFAFRHFFEWDPFLSCYAIFFPRNLLRPRFVPVVLGGHFWMRTRARRAFAWLCGILGLVRSRGERQIAFDRAVELVGRRKQAIAMFPTGPIGRSRTYDVRPGVGWLALRAPEAPVIPVSVHGLQSVTLWDVLRLRRPAVTIALGEEIRASELASLPKEERVEAICEWIRTQWTVAEAAVRLPERISTPAPSAAGAAPALAPAVVVRRV